MGQGQAREEIGLKETKPRIHPRSRHLCRTRFIWGFQDETGRPVSLQAPVPVMTIKGRFFPTASGGAIDTCHSGSPTVEIDVEVEAEMVTLAVRDAGRGIPKQVLEHFRETGSAGIGLAGMRERVADLGGEFRVQSNKRGTLLMASIPLRAGSPNSALKEFVA